MAEVKIPLVMLRANFIGPRTTELQNKGYCKMAHYDIWVKQEGERILIKRADERVKGESKIEYANFWEFTEHWTFRFKYIRDK